jgi:hypothetical protein
MYSGAWKALSRFVRQSALAVTIHSPAFSLNAQLLLLKDFNVSEDFQQKEYSSITDGHRKIYFIVNGAELMAGYWKQKWRCTIEKFQAY